MEERSLLPQDVVATLELAEMIGIEPNHMSNIELAKVGTSLDVVFRISVGQMEERSLLPQDVVAALDEIDRILRQMLVLSELSAGDGNINRANLL